MEKHLIMISFHLIIPQVELQRGARLATKKTRRAISTRFRGFLFAETKLTWRERVERLLNSRRIIRNFFLRFTRSRNSGGNMSGRACSRR
jgi:hypothetical protein